MNECVALQALPIDNNDSSKDTSFDGWDDSGNNEAGFLSFKRSSQVYNTLESGRVDETIKQAQEMVRPCLLFTANLSINRLTVMAGT